MSDNIVISPEELAKLGLVQTSYAQDELKNLRVIRISYTTDEIRERGVPLDENEVITSLDSHVEAAKQALKVEVSEGPLEGVTKWQLPIPKSEYQEVMQRTSFAPNVEIGVHSHPRRGESAAFRMILKGSIIFRDKEFKAGDWFYIPPEVEYSFKSGPAGAEVLHTYHAPCPRFEIDPFAERR